MDFGTNTYIVFLMGKKILYPNNAVDQCGYWPYEKKENMKLL